MPCVVLLCDCNMKCSRLCDALVSTWKGSVLQTFGWRKSASIAMNCRKRPSGECAAGLVWPNWYAINAYVHSGMLTVQHELMNAMPKSNLQYPSSEIAGELISNNRENNTKPKLQLSDVRTWTLLVFCGVAIACFFCAVCFMIPTCIVLLLAAAAICSHGMPYRCRSTRSSW